MSVATAPFFGIAPIPPRHGTFSPDLPRSNFFRALFAGKEYNDFVDILLSTRRFMMRKKILSFAVVAAMVMTVFVPVQALAKEKAEKPLLKSVKMKAYDAETKKWSTSYVTKYTYKKTYPTKILSTYYTGGKKTGEYYVEKNKYTFKNGKVKKRTMTGRYHMIGEKDTVSKTKYKYNKNGLPSVATMGTTMKTTYKYKKKMLSRLSYRYTYTDDKGKKAVDKNTIRYKLKQKNGLL